MNISKQSWNELALVQRVSEFMKSEGYCVRLEVPNMGQSADMVATKGRNLTFVEAKLENWRRAIHQCKAHEIVADYICIAVGSKGLSQAFLSLASEKGYGIIHCPKNQKVPVWIKRPAINRMVWKPQREFLLKNLKIIDYAN